MKKLKIFNVMCLTMLVISSITSCTFGNTLSSSSDNTTSQDISNTSNTSLVSSISFEEEGPINLKIGESHVLKINVENVSSFLIESSNTNVVKVVQTSSSYILRALSDGSATIYAKVNDEIYDSIEVNVVESAPTSIVISSTSNEALVGSSINISIDIDKQSYLDEVSLNIIEGSDLASIEGSEIYFASSGTIKVQASYQNIKSNILEFYAYDFTISLNSNDIEVGDHERIRISNFDGDKTKCSVIIEDEEILSSSGIDAFGYLHINALKVGSSSFYVQSSDGLISNKLVVNVVGGNPYLDIDKNEFYNNYKRATSLLDSQYRSECYLMSGDVTPQDQEPEIVSNQPKQGNMLIHNTSRNFSNNENVYTVYNVNGEKEFDIYYGGAYTSLEEVAAYIYAWGEVPVNYDPDKDAEPYNSNWGEYLRVNNTDFSGDTDKYPYEPVLPRIYGCDGDLVYYEIDIGTTGTDCDPDFPDRIYNDGYRITRGAARIVYSRYYADDTPSTMLDNEPITNLDDRYVFYTYNHYNDFQEYLNYYNGWGEMFGNITGGGTISSKVDYNPTPYVETYRKDLF